MCDVAGQSATWRNVFRSNRRRDAADVFAGWRNDDHRDCNCRAPTDWERDRLKGLILLSRC